ncbi:MAG TPA: hypothetical protein VL330_13035 [Actinomycetes bacterium]|nr:hypothetical protein [Actinomycetes bacterium]
MMGTGMRRATVGFLGWFGPRGLASIVFVLIQLEETPTPQWSLRLTVVTLTVAHGFDVDDLDLRPSTGPVHAYLALPGSRMICMRASDLPAATPHTASQHPISLSSIRPATCSSIERSEVPRCPPNGPTIDGKDGIAAPTESMRQAALVQRT